MNCKKVKKYLSLLADGVLDEKCAEQVHRHLACCESCSREYKKIVSMKRLLGADPSYKNLKHHIGIQSEKKQYMGGFSMKKGIIAVCTLLVLAAGLFVPVNGSSIAQALGIWGKTVSFTAYTFVRDGETVDSTVEVLTNVTPDADDIAAREEVKKNLVEKTYVSIEDAKMGTGIDFPAPKFMPEGMKLEGVMWSQLTTDPKNHGFLLDYIPDGSGKNMLPQSDGANINYIGIAYNIRTDNEVFPGATYQYQGDAGVKEINVHGRPGYAVTSELDGVRKLTIHLDMKGFSLSVGMRAPAEKATDDVVDKMEQELVKIAESIIS